MKAEAVLMPKMGESLTEGTLVKWHKKVGERVERDETLFEISTDKVDTPVSSPRDGIVLDIAVKEGETVPVLTVVCTIGDSLPEPGASPVQELAAPPKSPSAPGSGALHAPRVEAAAPAASESEEDRLREKSSPVVRKMAAEHGVDLRQISGSGIYGRVTKGDLERHLKERGSRSASSLDASDRLEPLSVMRQQIAEHMLLSRRTSAHVTSVFEVDMTAVRALKDKWAQQLLEDHDTKLTYLPFAAQSVCEALREHRLLNASIEGKSIRYHSSVGLGVAVALEEGLIVPVIHGAEQKSIVELARAIKDVSERARAKKLKPEEVRGGTFTITNPGVFGSLIGTPIIPQPQVAILCLGAVKKRPVVLEDTDAIAIRSMAYFSLSFDHRLIDGAVADRFLASVKSKLENPKHTP